MDDEHTQEVTTSNDHKFKVSVNFIDTYMIFKVLLRYADTLNRLILNPVTYGSWILPSLIHMDPLAS